MNKFQVLVAIAASLGGMLSGYDAGLINLVLVMDSFRIFFQISYLGW